MTKKTKKLLKDYIDASINNSWMGNTEPSQWPFIKERLKKAKRLLIGRLEALEFVLKKISAARESYNICGEYPDFPDGPSKDQVFHDWVAELINPLIGEL